MDTHGEQKKKEQIDKYSYSYFCKVSTAVAAIKLATPRQRHNYFNTNTV